MSFELELEPYANLTLRFEPWSTPHLGTYSAINLSIKGKKNRLTFVIPISIIPQQVAVSKCDQWIDIIQGPLASACDIDDEQRELVLHLFLGYRAYVRARPGALSDGWFLFAAELVSNAVAVKPDECVDGRLREIVKILHNALPDVVFADPTIPNITYINSPIQYHPPYIIIEPEGVPREEQQVLADSLAEDLRLVAAKALPRLPNGASPLDYRELCLDEAQKEDQRRACGAPILRTPIGPPARPFNHNMSVAIPVYLFGSRETPLSDLVHQCIFVEIRTDGTQRVPPNHLFIPLEGGPPSAASPSLSAETFSPFSPTNTAITHSGSRSSPALASFSTADLTRPGQIPPGAPPIAIPGVPPPMPLENSSRQGSQPPEDNGPLLPSTHASASSARASTSTIRASVSSSRASVSSARASVTSPPASASSSRASTGSRMRTTAATAQAAIHREQAAREAARLRAREKRDARAAARRAQAAARYAQEAARRAAAQAAGEPLDSDESRPPSLVSLSDSSDNVSEYYLQYPDDE